MTVILTFDTHRFLTEPWQPAAVRARRGIFARERVMA
jgi:hypothetical protein